jgi:putative methionine-R-sulfoxide reductase with GAF domain
MSSSALEAIADAARRLDDADDVLRATVDILVAEPEVEWAGIAFLEAGALVLGPQTGSSSETRRAAVPVVFEGSMVGELQVEGDVDDRFLEQVASLVAPYVLIGWDTQGMAWEP